MKKTILAVLVIIITCCSFKTNNIAPSLTVAYDLQKKTVLIKWQQQFSGVKSFIIQRSADGDAWEDIAWQATVHFNPEKIYQYIDGKPVEGYNHYRMKCITDDEQAEYSSSVFVDAGIPAFNWDLYTVPVNNVLALQYIGRDRINGVISMTIQNMSGQVLARLRSSSLNKLIQYPLSNLGKGVYDIRITVGDEKVWSQRFER
jgi:hypothetical protein